MTADPSTWPDPDADRANALRAPSMTPEHAALVRELRRMEGLFGDGVPTLLHAADAIESLSQRASEAEARWNLAASVVMKADERADELQREVSDLCAKVDQTEAECDALRAELAAAKRDAERYQWLKKMNSPYLCQLAWQFPAARKDEVANDPDLAIDAAIAAQAKGADE